MLKSATSRDAFIILHFCEENDVSSSSEVVSHEKLFSYSCMRRICSSRRFVLRGSPYVSVSNRKTIHHIDRSGLFAEMLSLLCLSTSHATSCVIHMRRINNGSLNTNVLKSGINVDYRIYEILSDLRCMQLQVVSMVKHGRDKDVRRNHAITLLRRVR